MVRRIAACLALAAFFWIEWRDVVAPLMASRHPAAGAPLGTLGLLLLPVGGILASLWLLFGPGLRPLFENSDGQARPTSHLVLMALLAVGLAGAGIAWFGRDRGEAGFGARASIDFPASTAVQFTPDRITFTPEGGTMHAMGWAELDSIGLVGGSAGSRPGTLQVSWSFADLNRVHYNVPQAAITERALVDAAQAHFGNRVQERPVERLAADARMPENAKALAKGSDGLVAWVWFR